MWSVHTPGGPEVVVGPPGGPELLRRPSRRSGTGWHFLPEVQEWLGFSPGGSGVVGKPSRRSEIGR